MRTIWKYEVPIWDTTVLDLCNPKVVAVRNGPTKPRWPQVEPSAFDHYVTVWIEHTVNEDLPMSSIYLVVYGTGHPIATLDEHVGTVFDDPFVWHVYSKVVA